jgi:hypothetical protein
MKVRSEAASGYFTLFFLFGGLNFQLHDFTFAESPLI